MVNEAEYEICKTRGHTLSGLDSAKWQRCRWCGIWVRKKTVLEEQSDEPAASEQDPTQRYGGPKD